MRSDVSTVPRKSRLTDNMQVSELRLGRSRVDLTHVATLVLFVYWGDVQEPRAVLVVRNADARVARDHVVVHRQDGRLLEVHPRHLRNKEIWLVFYQTTNKQNSGREYSNLIWYLYM